MGTTAAELKYPTMADVMARVGEDVPYTRVRLHPAPGTATEDDLLDPSITGDRLYELVDGILLEKAMGWAESRLAVRIGHFIQTYLDANNLGVLAGADGGIRFALDLVRMPDVSFVSWDAADDPAELVRPGVAFLPVPPDLAIEVLSPGNTPSEMAIKLGEYAKAGVKLVWYVDPARREVDVYPKGRAKGKKTVGIDGVLDGGAVLPGFTLSVATIFEAPTPPKKPVRKGRK